MAAKQAVTLAGASNFNADPTSQLLENVCAMPYIMRPVDPIVPHLSVMWTPPLPSRHCFQPSNKEVEPEVCSAQDYKGRCLVMRALII